VAGVVPGTEPAREPPPRSVLLGLYLALSRRAGPFARRLIARRAAAGKEDTARTGERMGEPGLALDAVVPEGGRLAWFHAASVGEAASLLEFLRRLTREHDDLACLVTTGTVTSARFLAERLPERCVHQFAPLDVQPWVARFLDHWQPDLAIWTESELWPATLCETHRRGVPMLLINARISARTYRRWRWLGALPAALLGRFERILAQDDLAAQQLEALGAEGVEVAGSLKEGALPLPHDEAERARLARVFAGRPVWLAASTHPGEEEMVAAVHGELRRQVPMLALVLAPRHPERGPEIAEMLRAKGFTVARRGAGEPPGPETDIYLADTLGEMGLWYRLAAVAFVGGSLVEVGGHNPYEPALLGCAILHGPHVRNFRDGYTRLGTAGAALAVKDEAGLARALGQVLVPDRAATMAAAAWDAVSEGAQVTDRVLEVVGAALDRPRAPAVAG
jgi:3-deoxy-D-manno-octulosonic-acid transferase